MNRLLSILVTLFILFLVYLWINHLTQGSQIKADPRGLATETLPPEEIEEEVPVPEPDTMTLPTGSDSATPDSKTPPQETRKSPQTEAPAQPKSVTPVSEPVSKPVSKTEKPQPKPKPAAKVVDPSSLHLVIAGNFLTRANAEERVKELQKLGYTQAEVVNFELSEYHTACAGRYSDLNEARRVSKKIKEMHNIDTYVRLGN